MDIAPAVLSYAKADLLLTDLIAHLPPPPAAQSVAESAPRASDVDTIVLSAAAKALLEAQQAASLATIVTDETAPDDSAATPQVAQSAPGAGLTDALEGAVVQEALSIISDGSAEAGNPAPTVVEPAIANAATPQAETEAPEITDSAIVYLATTASTAQNSAATATETPEIQLEPAAVALASQAAPLPQSPASQTIPLTNAYAFAAASLVGVELGPRQRRDRQAVRLKNRALRSQPQASTADAIGEGIWHAILRMNA